MFENHVWVWNIEIFVLCKKDADLKIMIALSVNFLLQSTMNLVSSFGAILLPDWLSIQYFIMLRLSVKDRFQRRFYTSCPNFCPSTHLSPIWAESSPAFFFQTTRITTVVWNRIFYKWFCQDSFKQEYGSLLHRMQWRTKISSQKGMWTMIYHNERG